MTALEHRDKVLVSIAHLCILIQIPGLFLALAIYFLNNEKSQFFTRGVRQAIGLQLTVTVFIFIYRAMVIFGLILLYDGRSFNLLQMGFSILYIIAIIFAIYAASRSYKGFDYRYPIIGSFFEIH
ncbi:MAG: DUF4870 domain-containing protein [Dehalobacterium sp.]